jgi:hypothetical protein
MDRHVTPVEVFQNSPALRASVELMRTLAGEGLLSARLFGSCAIAVRYSAPMLRTLRGMVDVLALRDR